MLTFAPQLIEGLGLYYVTMCTGVVASMVLCN
jgi:hypothetical protein